MSKELSDEQIIKALECCSVDICATCPIHIFKCKNKKFLCEQALNLINRLKEENAELNAENERLYKKISNLKEDLIHCHEKVFYRECNVVLRENEIKAQGSKETAKEILGELIYTLVINNEENTETFDYQFTLETIKQLADKYGVELFDEEGEEG